MKSLLGLLLLAAAPLVAQNSAPQTIVFKVILTTITTSSVQPPPSGNPDQPPVIVPVTPPVTDPPVDPPTGAGSSSNPPAGCVSFYSDAVTVMNDLYTNLLYTQQLYTTAQSSTSTSTSAYAANHDTLMQMQLASQDARDIIKIVGPQNMIASEVAGVSSDVAAIPALVNSNAQLPLDPVITNMQSDLTKVTNLINASSCPQSTP
jgi:hypothetical protein